MCQVAILALHLSSLLNQSYQNEFSLITIDFHSKSLLQFYVHYLKHCASTHFKCAVPQNDHLLQMFSHLRHHFLFLYLFSYLDAHYCRNQFSITSICATNFLHFVDFGCMLTVYRVIAMTASSLQAFA